MSAENREPDSGGPALPVAAVGALAPDPAIKAEGLPALPEKTLLALASELKDLVRRDRASRNRIRNASDPDTP